MPGELPARPSLGDWQAISSTSTSPGDVDRVGPARKCRADRRCGPLGRGVTAWMTPSVRPRPFGRRRGLPTVVAQCRPAAQPAWRWPRRTLRAYSAVTIDRARIASTASTTCARGIAGEESLSAGAVTDWRPRTPSLPTPGICASPRCASGVSPAPGPVRFSRLASRLSTPCAAPVSGVAAGVSPGWGLCASGGGGKGPPVCKPFGPEGPLLPTRAGVAAEGSEPLTGGSDTVTGPGVACIGKTEATTGGKVTCTGPGDVVTVGRDALTGGS